MACGRPEDAAREQDLVVQLLGGASTDGHTLLVVHHHVVPHVVGGGNWAHVVYLQPGASENTVRKSGRHKVK